MPRNNPALQDYVRVQREFDAQLNALLERTAQDIQARIVRLGDKEGIGARVRRDQLRATLAEIRQEQISMWTDGVQGNIVAGRKAAAEAAQGAYDRIASVAYTALPSDVAETLSDSLQRTARAGLDNLYSRVPRELSQAVYRNGLVAAGVIEDTIQRGIAAGLSAKEMAAEVHKFISPTTPGGVSYAASRLARTEINNAFHEQQKKAGFAPGVLGTKWNLSGSHPKPDACNTYADDDHDNLGAGVFKPANVPNKPHPQCLCYLTYITMEPERFAAELQKGSFDEELRRRTELNVKRLKDRAAPEVKKAVPAPKKAVPELTGPEKRAAARARQRQIEAADNLGVLGQEIDRVLANIKPVQQEKFLRQNLEFYRESLSEDVFAQLFKDMHEGDMAALRRHFDAYAERRGLTPIGQANRRVKFDERYHDTFEGASFNPENGDDVLVAVRGYKFQPSEIPGYSNNGAVVLHKATVVEAPARPGLATRPMKRIKGEDLVDDFIDNPGVLFEREDFGWNDPVLEAIVERQGFDGLPGVAQTAQFEERLADGWKEVFRGVKPRRDKPASQILDDLRSASDFQIGTGVYGNGMYTSVRRETSERYALHREGLGEDGVVRIAISPKAKVVDFRDLKAEQQSFMDGMREDFPNLDSIREKLYDDPGLLTADEIPLAKFVEAVEDEGRFAAMRGYDVVKVVGREDGAGSTADQYVILNRTMIIVEDTP